MVSNIQGGSFFLPDWGKLVRMDADVETLDGEADMTRNYHCSDFLFSMKQEQRHLQGQDGIGELGKGIGDVRWLLRGDQGKVPFGSSTEGPAEAGNHNLW